MIGATAKPMKKQQLRTLVQTEDTIFIGVPVLIQTVVEVERF